MSLARLGIPYMTTSQRIGVTPNDKDLVYDTDLEQLYVGDGATAGGNPVSGGIIKDNYTAGENLVNGDLCYLKSDAKFWKADADAESTASTKLVIATDTINADATGVFLIYGTYITSGMTAGLQYVSKTAGEWTEVAPSGSGEIVKIIGTAESATVLYFNPDNTFIEIA
jgi:hypothetical protein